MTAWRLPSRPSRRVSGTERGARGTRSGVAFEDGCCVFGLLEASVDDRVPVDAAWPSAELDESFFEPTKEFVLTLGVAEASDAGRGADGVGLAMLRIGVERVVRQKVFDEEPAGLLVGGDECVEACIVACVDRLDSADGHVAGLDGVGDGGIEIGGLGVGGSCGFERGDGLEIGGLVSAGGVERHEQNPDECAEGSGRGVPGGRRMVGERRSAAERGVAFVG